LTKLINLTVVNITINTQRGTIDSDLLLHSVYDMRSSDAHRLLICQQKAHVEHVISNTGSQHVSKRGRNH